VNKDYPLYPKLTEEGEQEAQRIMDSFKSGLKARLKDLMDEVLGDLYCNVAYHIESDSWTNYRNDLMDGFKGYKTGNHEHDFKELRQAIYANHKEEIIKDLNRDMVGEIEKLKEQIKWLEKINSERY